MKQDHEIFYDHLQKILGPEDAIYVVKPKDGTLPVSVFVYKNVPSVGMITGITYGLSHCDFPEWKFARPEMILSVNSLSVEWPCAAAAMAGLFRGEKRFRYGDTMTTDATLASDTEMDGFLIFAPSFLKKQEQFVELNNYKIHFSQFYPIYRSELKVYKKIGLEAFWKHKDFDLYDVKRPPIDL